MTEQDGMTSDPENSAGLLRSDHLTGLADESSSLGLTSADESSTPDLDLPPSYGAIRRVWCCKTWSCEEHSPDCRYRIEHLFTGGRRERFCDCLPVCDGWLEHYLKENYG